MSVQRRPPRSAPARVDLVARRRRGAAAPARLRPEGTGDAGSTVPLILLFFLIAVFVVAGSVALGDAALDQSSLQSTCDSASIAVAASAVAVSRDSSAPQAPFDTSRVPDALRAYLARDPSRATLELAPTLSADNLTLTRRCRQSISLTFGLVFGRPDVVHTAVSTARAPTTGR